MEAESNPEFRNQMLNRSFFLLPFNGLVLKGTLWYAKNINRIARKMWPNRQKVSVMNFFIVGTMQALVFFTGYVGGTCLCLGYNPFRAFREHKVAKQYEIDLIARTQIDYEKPAEA
jgi:hypothetical protein